MRSSRDRAVRHPRHVLDRTHLPGIRVPRVRRLRLEGGQGCLGDTGDLSEPGGDAGDSEFDFRIGGRECFGVGYQGVTLRYDARYYDIVPGQRIIYSYEMYADNARISVSVATIEFVPAASGTALTWTEQGAYLDGFNGAEASRLRQEGTAEMLDGLAKYLA
jgi:uncharacterized protein YndB with AHSA1/START domain